MPRAVRTDSIDIDRQTSVRAVIEQTPDADHAAELTLKNDGERWVYTLTDEREATLQTEPCGIKGSFQSRVLPPPAATAGRQQQSPSNAYKPIA